MELDTDVLKEFKSIRKVKVHTKIIINNIQCEKSQKKV